MSARQRAITATWVATLTAATTDEQLAETMRRDPTICIELLGDDRHPVRVSVRPAEDLPQTDPLGLAPQLAARPAAPDLYHGPALAAEALRRVFEADRALLFPGHPDAGSVAYRAPDGVLVSIGTADLYGEHMRATAYVLAQLADVAARLDPDRPDRDEWAAALSAVHALTPDDSEDDLPEQDEDASPPAVRQRQDGAS